jgi:hypothetical protein
VEVHCESIELIWRRKPKVLVHLSLTAKSIGLDDLLCCCKLMT